MKFITNRRKWYAISGMIFWMLFAMCGLTMADGVTANLAINPTPCQRGDVLRFTATIFNNPTIGTQPGTAYYSSVVLDTTNHPELNPWSTELKTFDYPAPGKTTTVNFTSTYTVPQDLKGETICFYVTEGKEKTNKISYKTCIKVVASVKPLIKEKVRK